MVCHELRRQVASELGGGVAAHHVRIYQLLGQDSFEDTVRVFLDARRLETMLHWSIVLFPRTSAPKPVVVPPDVTTMAAKFNVRFEVAESYRDPTPQLSSTRLRKALADASTPYAAAVEPAAGSGPPEGIHPAVWTAAVARGVYAPLAPSACRLHATVLGAPGSGKTSLCNEMVRRLGRGVLRHVSGGDFHRAACAELVTEGYGDAKWLNSLKCGDVSMHDSQLTRFIYQCHVTTLQLLDGVGLRCFLSDLKDPEQLHILERGHLAAFEGREGAPMAFDVVFEIVCSESTIRKRLEGRAKRIGDWKSESERLDAHLQEKNVYAKKGARDQRLAEYGKLRSRTQVMGAQKRRANPRVTPSPHHPKPSALTLGHPLNPPLQLVPLDGEQSIAAICDEMEAVLRRVATAKGIALPAADGEAPPTGTAAVATSTSTSSGGGAVKAAVQRAIHGVLDRALLRHVTKKTWHEGGFSSLLKSPRGGRGGGQAGFGGKGGGSGGKGGGAAGGRGGGGSGESSPRSSGSLGSRGGFGGKGGGGGDGKGGGGEAKGGNGGGQGKGGRGRGNWGSDRESAPSGSGSSKGGSGGYGKGSGASGRGKGGAGDRTRGGGGGGGGDGSSRADTQSWRR